MIELVEPFVPYAPRARPTAPLRYTDRHPFPEEGLEARLAALVPGFSDWMVWDLDMMRAALKTHDKVDSPCAMQVEDDRALEAHMHALYQIGVAHYLLGETQGYAFKSFPEWCCGASSTSCGLSALGHGYANTIDACKTTAQHQYLVFPFVSPSRNGVVLLEPTAAQVWKGGIPKVTVTVKSGSSWKYVTDWNPFKETTPPDLYPDKLGDIGRLRERVATGNEYLREWKIELDVRIHLEEAFRNPVPAPQVINT